MRTGYANLGARGVVGGCGSGRSGSCGLLARVSNGGDSVGRVDVQMGATLASIVN